MIMEIVIAKCVVKTGVIAMILKMLKGLSCQFTGEDMGCYCWFDTSLMAKMRLRFSYFESITGLFIQLESICRYSHS